MHIIKDYRFKLGVWRELVWIYGFTWGEALKAIRDSSLLEAFKEDEDAVLNDQPYDWVEFIRSGHNETGGDVANDENDDENDDENNDDEK